MYTVKRNKQVKKNIEKIPLSIQKKFFFLINDLERLGPIRTEWQNFSSLGENEYHCHLSHKWVACWRCEKNSIIIEVYYAGSRENAPY
ncbi:MAG: hypothetical protein CVV49_01410 [Spirochaetae bacterium HGW-Spirochaetae-5]|nr:MAG: hypothetical protein CVV49_01410 [Spirochaetae bacterium HGW-Spirochaetae-5]